MASSSQSHKETSFRKETSDVEMHDKPHPSESATHSLHHQLDLFLKGQGREHPEATALLGRFFEANLPFEAPVDRMSADEMDIRLERAYEVCSIMRQVNEDDGWQFTNYQLAALVAMPSSAYDRFFTCVLMQFFNLDTHITQLPWTIRHCK